MTDDPEDPIERLVRQVALGRIVIDPAIEGDDLRARIERLVRIAVGGRADAADLVVSVVRVADRGRASRWVVTVHNLNHGEVPGAGALLEAALQRIEPAKG